MAHPVPILDPTTKQYRCFIPQTNDVYITLPVPATPVQTALFAYAHQDEYAKQTLEFPTKQSLFRTIVHLLWGKNKAAQFEWNPWAEEISEVIHTHQYAAIAGCANSNKTDTLAVYGLVNWAADPRHTLVLATSTSIKDSRRRIWGSITKYYMAAGGDAFFGGRLLDSLHTIRTNDGSGTFNDKMAITVIAGDRAKEKENIGHLIGVKQKRLFLIADEMPELSESLITAAISNLGTGKGTASGGFEFHMVGLGNLWSMVDPFGRFCEPKDGWRNVSVEDKGWETKFGYCLHLDGMKSPNFDEAEDKWPFLYNRKSLKDHRARCGENSAEFWRMCRAFIVPVGTEDTIFSESDFLMGDAMSKVQWLYPPTPVAFLDPSFTTGGDRAVASFGYWGMSVSNVWTLQLEEQIVLREDVSLSTVPRNYQLADQYMQLCQKKKVQPFHAGLDVTGAGREFYDRITDQWKAGDISLGIKVMALEFGGKPSNLPTSLNGNKTCDDAYDRKVTELWYAPKEFLDAKQLRGLTDALISELKVRKYEISKKGGSARISVEPKKDMKMRTGQSPDLADSYVGLLELCRQRLKAMPMAAQEKGSFNTQDSRRNADAYNDLYEMDNMYTGTNA